LPLVVGHLFTQSFGDALHLLGVDAQTRQIPEESAAGFKADLGCDAAEHP